MRMNNKLKGHHSVEFRSYALNHKNLATERRIFAGRRAVLSAQRPAGRR
jgi:hypothetical protein